MRGCYTAMATAHMLCLDKHALARRAGMASFIRRCQVRCSIPGTHSNADPFMLPEPVGHKRQSWVPDGVVLDTI